MLTDEDVVLNSDVDVLIMEFVGSMHMRGADGGFWCDECRLQCLARGLGCCIKVWSMQHAQA